MCRARLHEAGQNITFSEKKKKLLGNCELNYYQLHRAELGDLSSKQLE